MSVLVRIACPHCQRQIGVDTSKMPAKAVSFACPSCGGKVVLDPSRLEAAPSGRSKLAEAVEEALGPEPTPVPTQSPPPAPEPEVSLELPPGVTLPHGFIAGEDRELVEQVRAALAAHDGKLELLEAPAQLATVAPEELPPLLVLVGGAVTQPPFAPLQPFVRLPVALRRRCFVVLVADNLATLDGSAAFVHEVNLVINRRDVPKTASILYSALQFHRRLWGSYFAALEANESA